MGRGENSTKIDKVVRHTGTVVLCALMVIHGGLKRKNQRESESGSLLLKFLPHLMSISLRFGHFLLLIHVTYFALVSKGYHHPYMKLVIDIIFQNLSKWTDSFAFSASKKRAKHYDDQPHCTYQSITIMQKMKWLMKSSKLLHDYLLMLLHHLSTMNRSTFHEVLL